MISKQDTLTKIAEIGLLAVLRGPGPELTLKMVEALVAGGVLGIEITYTTPNAAELVKAIDRHYGQQIALGMGTLTEPERSGRRSPGGRGSFSGQPPLRAGVGSGHGRYRLTGDDRSLNPL